MITRFKILGASNDILLDLYNKFVRSAVEYAVPAWNAGIGDGEAAQVERVQKSSLSVIFKNKSYTQNLRKAKFKTLKIRRDDTSTKFAIKTVKNARFNDWFVINPNPKNTRQINKKYKEPIFRCNRFKRSPIPYLTALLNKYQ